MMAKITNAEKIKRVSRIRTMLLHGYKRVDILQYASKKEWGVTNRSVDTYIRHATAQIRKTSNDEIDYERGLAKERLDFLYNKDVSIQDYKAALAVIKVRSDLLGLEAPKKTDITSRGEKIQLTVVYKDEL